MSSLDRYTRYAWHYEAVTTDRFRPGEDLFYAALARTTGGPALEPACGAARVLSAVYAAGVEVWGTDASPDMLTLARERLRAIRAADPRLRSVGFHLRRKPIRRLDLPPRFGLILLPLESFRLLRSRAEQTAFLASARRHLGPRGRLALDLTLPEADLPDEAIAQPLPHPGGGTVVARARWVWQGDDVVEQTVFTVTEADGEVRREVCNDPWRVVNAGELRGLLADWRIERWDSDHLGTPYRPGDGRLVVVAAP